MSMLTLNGTVANIYEAPKGVNKETGEAKTPGKPRQHWLERFSSMYQEIAASRPRPAAANAGGRRARAHPSLPGGQR